MSVKRKVKHLEAACNIQSNSFCYNWYNA